MGQTFTNQGPRERVTPVRQRVGTVEAHDKSSSGKGGTHSERVYSRAPQRDARAAAAAQDKAAKAPEVEEETEDTSDETAEVAPQETAAVTMKPEARRVASAKRAAKK